MSAGQFHRQELLQIDVYPDEETEGVWKATEPGVPVTGRGEDGLQAAINYLEFCRESQPASG